MRDPFAGYDQWLERPFQDMMDESDQFYEWAENEGYDLDDPDQVKEAEEAYDTYVDDCNEAYNLGKYESHLERLEMEAEEYEYDERYYE